jgi:hypothetical protein
MVKEMESVLTMGFGVEPSLACIGKNLATLISTSAVSQTRDKLQV